MHTHARAYVYVVRTMIYGTVAIIRILPQKSKFEIPPGNQTDGDGRAKCDLKYEM